MSKSPGQTLKDFIYKFVDDHHLPNELKVQAPRKWEKYGDFVLLDARCLSSDVWLEQGPEFWSRVCEILKAKRLALKNRVQSDGYRTPAVRMVVGDDPWIMYTDNSIRYWWHAERNMFSAGNACERHRIAKLDCRGEVVVDLFAGIGYFVLPYLVHARAKLVHAVEWNPDAIIALRRNLRENRVDDRCVVYEGDNNRVCPKGVADRVNLGLIPSSECSWKVACQALKPGGGVLHVHGNVESLKMDDGCRICARLSGDVYGSKPMSMTTCEDVVTCGEPESAWKHRQWVIWGVHVLHTLVDIMRDLKIGEGVWTANIYNIHHVKSYAPHVDHLVLDVLLRPRGTWV